MDKNAIKKYAVWARRELISRVSQRAALYEITDKGFGDASADSVLGRVLSAEEKRQRQALIAQIREKGFEQVMEEIAYTWFNRFIALRFMEVNGYLPSRVRVFTDDENNFKPQILAEAINMELDGLDMEKVYALKNANDDNALFKYMIIVQCNALSIILPGMFQRISDYTELLFPDNLLREGSVIEQMVSMIPEEDWTDQVQIIGWLYQYYNTEPKDKVFADLKKNIKISKESIPAATQLFTPDWIVHYMVENSLGRLWVEGHPNDALKSEWKYYLDEAEQEPEVQTQLSAIRKEYAALKPEDLRAIDPCCGSGHILCYLFDVLIQIYETQGYTARDATQRILIHNLWGLDIDVRAAQLSYFAVMMKARQYDRRFFSRSIQPHVYAIAESNGVNREAVEYFCKGNAALTSAMQTIQAELYDAKEYGSILTCSKQDWDVLYARFNEVDDDITLYRDETLALLPLVQTAEALSQKYDLVVTNPPYMGSSNMSGKLSEYVKKHYPDSKSDLFAVFIEQGNNMVKPYCYNCMVTMQSWMFLSSFEKMRIKIMKTKTITSLMHMNNMVMHIAFGTSVTIYRNTYIKGYRGTYNQIKAEDIIEDKDEHPICFPIKKNRFAQVSADNFAKIPGEPVAYWVSPKLLTIFETAPKFVTICKPCVGLQTADNTRFLRLWHECSFAKIGFGYSSLKSTVNSQHKWFPYNKGGDFRRWYGNRYYVINWEDNGNEVRHNPGAVIRNPTTYFLPCITWSDITSSIFSGRYCEGGFLYDVKGSCGFPSMETLYYVLGFLNSKIAQECIKILNPSVTTQVGDLSRIPVQFSSSQYNEIDRIVRTCIEMSKTDWDSFEISWDFQRHPLLPFFADDPGKSAKIEMLYRMWEDQCQRRFNKLKINEEELNRIFIDIYGLQDELTPEVEDKDVTVRKADLTREIKSLISYAVGCMFGRYSLDVAGLCYAGGNWDTSKYKTFIPDADAILPICDDDYFADDIVGRFVKFVEIVYGEATLEENLRFIADALDGKGSSREVIRSYFLSGFYADHLKVYQKRPIYWLFDSGKKNGFKCLVYMHRYQSDTIARIRTDYVHEQQSRYRTAIADLEIRIANAGTGERVKLSKQLTKLQEQAEELRVYEEKIHHLADQMIHIDLDDGVKKNYTKFQDVLAIIK